MTVGVIVFPPGDDTTDASAGKAMSNAFGAALMASISPELPAVAVTECEFVPPGICLAILSISSSFLQQ